MNVLPFDQLFSFMGPIFLVTLLLPLIITGAVIGVNAAAAQSAEGLGFAIPIDAAADIMAQARAKVGVA